jgi:hypothetical protein
MKVSQKTVGGKTFFLVSELDPPHQKAANDLGFVKVDEGFGRVFEANTPHLDQIFARFASFAEEMILQASGVRSVPWDKALLSFLERTSGESVDWWLAGSTALAVRGIDSVPRDLDIITDTDGAQRLGRAMSEWLVEPVQESHGWIARWFGRAFAHARIEWVGDVENWVDDRGPSDFGPAARTKLQTVRWGGYKIRVPPLEMQLAVCERRGLNDRAQKIRQALGHSKNAQKDLEPD